MAATNSTTNLGLPQWEATDKILRTDLNTAFATLDEGTGSGITVVDTYPTEEDGADGDVYAVKGASGVWTPTITIGGSSTGITYGGGQAGFYWIVGKLLFWICEVGFDKASLSGAVNLLGFPVNTSSSRPYPAINVSQFNGIDSPPGALGLFILHAGGSNIGMMRFSFDNASWSDFTTSHMYASTAFFRAQGFYQID